VPRQDLQEQVLLSDGLDQQLVPHDGGDAGCLGGQRCVAAAHSRQLVQVPGPGVVAQHLLGGLGGCPFAPGASGNTATEDLIYALNKNGVETGIDYDKLIKIAKYEFEKIPSGNFSGHQIKVPEHPCVIRQD